MCGQKEPPVDKHGETCASNFTNQAQPPKPTFVQVPGSQVKAEIEQLSHSKKKNSFGPVTSSHLKSSAIEFLKSNLSVPSINTPQATSNPTLPSKIYVNLNHARFAQNFPTPSTMGSHHTGIKSAGHPGSWNSDGERLKDEGRGIDKSKGVKKVYINRNHINFRDQKIISSPEERPVDIIHLKNDSRKQDAVGFLKTKGVVKSTENLDNLTGHSYANHKQTHTIQSSTDFVKVGKHKLVRKAKSLTTNHLDSNCQNINQFKTMDFGTVSSKEGDSGGGHFRPKHHCQGKLHKPIPISKVHNTRVKTSGNTWSTPNIQKSHQAEQNLPQFRKYSKYKLEREKEVTTTAQDHFRNKLNRDIKQMKGRLSHHQQKPKVITRYKVVRSPRNQTNVTSLSSQRKVLTGRIIKSKYKLINSRKRLLLSPTTGTKMLSSYRCKSPGNFIIYYTCHVQ